MIEILLHLDRSNRATTKITKEFNRFTCKKKIYQNNFGDPGVSRNFLVKKSNGKYIAFIDADDYFSTNWLWEAWKRAKNYKRPCIFSPKTCICFDDDGIKLITQIWSSNDKRFCETNTLIRNPIFSSNFVSKEIYKKVPYTPNNKYIGYEDWRWNLDAIAAGYKIVAVDETIFFYRQKRVGSLNIANLSATKTIGTSKFFNPKIFLQLSHIPLLDQSTSKVAQLENRAQSIRVTNKHRGKIKKIHFFSSPKIITKRYIIKRFGLNSYLYRICRDTYYFTRTTISVPVFALLEKMGFRDVEISYGYTIDPYRRISGQLQDILTEKENIYFNQITQTEPQLKPALFDYHSIDYMSYPSLLRNIYRDICLKVSVDIEQIVVVDNLEIGSEDYQMLKELIGKQNNPVLILALNSVSANTISNIQGSNKYFYNSLIETSDIESVARLIMILIDNWPNIEKINCFPGRLAQELIQKYNEHILHSKHKIVWHISKDSINSNSFGRVSQLIQERHNIISNEKEVSNLLANRYGIGKTTVYNTLNTSTRVDKKFKFAVSKNIQPETTIIMPVYNAEKYVAAAIESILNQTYRNFIFLIIDDGSSDNSLKIIEKYALLDKRIRIVKQANKGLVATLNHHITTTKTEFIARMDADDISLPTRIDEQISYLKSNPNIGVLGCLTQNIAHDDTPLDINVRPSNSDCLKLLSGGYCQLAGPSIAARRKCLIDAGLFKHSEFPAEDYGLWTRIARIDKYNLFLLPKVLYYYRVNLAGISKTLQNKQLETTGVIGAYFRQRKILDGYKYYNYNLFSSWINSANYIPDIALQKKLIGEYIKLMLWYIGDHYKLDKSKATHSINIIQKHISKGLGTLEAEKFNNTVNNLLIGKENYGINNSSQITGDNCKITVIMTGTDVAAKLNQLSKSKNHNATKVIILCDNKTKPFTVWSKQHIVNLETPFAQPTNIQLLSFGLGHVQTPYVFFMGRKLYHQEDIDLLYSQIRRQKIDLVLYQQKRVKNKYNTNGFENFLALTSSIKYLIGSDNYQRSTYLPTLLSSDDTYIRFQYVNRKTN